MESDIQRSRQARRISIVCATLLWLVPPDPAQSAGGAYIVDDAAIAPLGTCESENWVSVAANHDLSGVFSTACTVRIGVPTEFTNYYQGSTSAGLSTNAYGLQAKIAPIDTRAYALSLTGGFFSDSATQTISGLVNMPMTFFLRRDFRIHVDAGWLHDSRVNVDYATGGVGFEWDFVPKLSLQGEIYFQEGRQSLLTPSFALLPRTQLGLRWTPAPAVDLDVIIGNNLSGKGVNWGTLGVNFRPQAR